MLAELGPKEWAAMGWHPAYTDRQGVIAHLEAVEATVGWSAGGPGATVLDVICGPVPIRRG